jgi:hypothetical protein
MVITKVIFFKDIFLYKWRKTYMTVEILPWSAGTGPPIAIEIHHPVCSKILSARLATVRGSFSMLLISRVVNIIKNLSSKFTNC